MVRSRISVTAIVRSVGGCMAPLSPHSVVFLATDFAMCPESRISAPMLRQKRVTECFAATAGHRFWRATSRNPTSFTPLRARSSVIQKSRQVITSLSDRKRPGTKSAMICPGMILGLTTNNRKSHSLHKITKFSYSFEIYCIYSSARISALISLSLL